MSKAISIRNVTNTHRQTEGAGFVVRRALGQRMDPFLMLDHMGPVQYPPYQAVGAPDHPHRGFQTVTYLLEGEFQHLDSEGHKGILRGGDVQWMHAGRGVIHSETPSDAFFKTGGLLEGRTFMRVGRYFVLTRLRPGFQLWVNVPNAQKMTPPNYQEYAAKDIPCAKTASGNEVVVIAGATHGVQATIKTLSPIVYLDIRMTARNSSETFVVPPGHRGLVYAYRGAGTAGGGPLAEGQVGLLEEAGELVVSVADSELRLLLIAGVPIGEPVFQRGPFVMASERDLMQAFIDYQHGTLAKPMEGGRGALRAGPGRQGPPRAVKELIHCL